MEVVLISLYVMTLLLEGLWQSAVNCGPMRKWSWLITIPQFSLRDWWEPGAVDELQLVARVGVPVKCVLWKRLLYLALSVLGAASLFTVQCSTLAALFQNSTMRPSPPTHPSSQPSPHPQPPPPHSQMMSSQVSVCVSAPPSRFACCCWFPASPPALALFGIGSGVCFCMCVCWHVQGLGYSCCAATRCCDYAFIPVEN